MKCPSCGQENAEGARFCNQCGSALAPAQPGAAYPSPAGSGWQPTSPAAVAAPPTATRIPSPRTVPPSASDDRNVVGQVSGLQQRTETTNWGIQNVWSFKVERFDPAGNRLQPIPVEMRATQLPGVLNEGDWVRIPGRWQPGQTLHPKEVRNLTTDGLVGVPGRDVGRGRGSLLAVLGTLLALLITAFIQFVLVSVLREALRWTRTPFGHLDLDWVPGFLVVFVPAEALVIAFWIWRIRRARRQQQE